MPNLDTQIESVLFFRNEPVTLKELSSLLGVKPAQVKESLERIALNYQERGIVLVNSGEEYCFGTSPQNSALIEKLEKDELSKDLGRAGLETLAVILYRGPISRREIDQIRGVNSGYILRNLMIRGLVERADPETLSGYNGNDRSFAYKPTLKLFEYLGVTSKEALPEYERAWQSLEEFVKSENTESNDA